MQNCYGLSQIRSQIIIIIIPKVLKLFYYIPFMEIFGREKISEFGKSQAIRQNFPHQCTKNTSGICTDFSISTKFFFANSFYLYGSQNFPRPTKIFPCTVH